MAVKPSAPCRGVASCPFLTRQDAASAPVRQAQGKPEARVVGDFFKIILPGGREMLLHRRYKRRAFLRAAHEWCVKNHTDTFDWQMLVDDYNAQFKNPKQEKHRIKSDRIDNDLFKGQLDEFRELFGLPDRANSRLQFKVELVFKK
jgi:hypothetical protein